MTRTDGAGTSLSITPSPYERMAEERRLRMARLEAAAAEMALQEAQAAALSARHRLYRLIPCRPYHDGAVCVLEPLHDDWHADTLGRRWP